jgi:CDP-glucose 4,6-dehydratase
MNLNFWKDKRVFLTGHTGFKGSWLSRILIGAGVQLTGYALEPPTNPNLFSLCDARGKMNSVIGDVRDKENLAESFRRANPEIVIHMAAQPLVRESYLNPVYTYETNVMGVVNLLECIRLHGESVKSVVNVTTDKVYYNNEWCWGYRETDPLDGYDPYSNSKSCSELVTNSYRNAYFNQSGVACSTVRAGNVIGGGDFSDNRIIPDCVRAALNKEHIVVRNPHSVRPYQHVLEPLFAYLMIAERQWEDSSFASSYNVGPDEQDCVTTGALVDSFCRAWGESQSWENLNQGGPHEAGSLKLDCSKLKSMLNWYPKWNVNKAVEKTIEWTQVYREKGSIPDVMDKQIKEYQATWE